MKNDEISNGKKNGGVRQSVRKETGLNKVGLTSRDSRDVGTCTEGNRAEWNKLIKSMMKLAMAANHGSSDFKSIRLLVLLEARALIANPQDSAAFASLMTLIHRGVLL